MTPEGSYGTWNVLVEADRRGALSSLGARELRAGEEISFRPDPASAVAGLALLRLGRTVF